MLKIRIYAVILFLFIILGCAKKAVVKEDSILLSHKFQEGEITKYEMTAIIATTMNIQNRMQDMTTNISFIISNQIEKISGDTVFMKLSIDKAEGSIKVSGMMQAIPDINKLKGKSSKVVLLKNGEVLDIKSDKEIEDAQDKGIELKDYVENLYSFLPDKELNIGDIWKKDSDDKGVHSQAVYTIIGLKEDNNGKQVAIISKESNESVNKEVDQGGMKGEINISGKTKGKIFCSIEDGSVISSNMHSAMEGKISGIMGDMEIPIYTNQDVKIKKIK